MRRLRWLCGGTGLRGIFPLAGVVFLFAFLLIPQTARANGVTEQQYLKDLAIVNADITASPNTFSDSTVAIKDYALGVLSGTVGIVDLLAKNNSGAQTEFQIALNDFNGVLLVLGDAPLSGGDPVTEPSSLLQLGLGIGAVVLVFGRRHRQERRRRAAVASAS